MKITLLHNKKAGKVLASVSLHDFVSEDGVMIDGGQDGYVRYTLKEGWEFKQVDTSEVHKELSKFFKWGKNFDKNGVKLKQTQFIPISELASDHIEKILKTQLNINKFYKTVMEKELDLRKEVSTESWGSTTTSWFDFYNPSFGSERLIGSVNNSNNETIDKIKQLSRELVDLINKAEGDTEYKKLALVNIAQGQMWAVKSLF